MLLNMKDLLAPAYQHSFAIPAFNISDYNMFNAIMDLSEEKNAPVIIAIHPNELALIKPDMVKGIIGRIQNSSIPASIHLDHGASFDQVMLAIQCGFTSVMIDASSLPYEENTAVCQKVAEAAHAVNVSVEGELGTIGLNAVDAACRGHGIAGKLHAFALDKMRSEGATVAKVLTGLDDAHAPARRAYEKSGFRKNLPSVTYYKDLREEA
jgi:fructose/tagatose bisphosphate aldolase